MLTRSQRSRQSQLPKHLKDFVVNMSTGSTTSEGNIEQSGSSGEASADNTIVEQNENSNDIVASLMERLKNLEESNQRTMQQLLQSETKRLQLQERLSAKDATQQPTPCSVAQDQTMVQDMSSPVSHLNTSHITTSTTATHCLLRQQPTMNSTPMVTQCTIPTHSQGNITYSSSPYGISNNAPPIGMNYAPMTNGSFTANTHANFATCSTYTNAELPHASNNITTQASHMSQNSNVGTYGGNNVYVQTRKLYELPEFHGYPEQWPVFIAAFRESSQAYGYTDLENTFRLQKCLKGLAREEVECLLISPRNVPQIIEQLEFKYGRPELLIKSQLQKVREIVIIPENHLEKLVPFATRVQNLTTFLKSCNAVQHLNNPTLMEELISKMPMTKRIEWASYSSVISPYPTLEHFNAWINQMARVIARVTPNLPNVLSPGSMKNTVGQARTTTRPVLALVEEINKKQCCVKCQNSHSLSKCEQFLKLPVNERWDFVKKSRLCFSCLNRGHTLLQCRRKGACLVNGCKKIHNVKLHEEPDGGQEQVNMISKGLFSPKTTKLLYKILPIELRGANGKIVKTYAFVDEGSSSTLISSTIASRLGCKQEMKPLTLRWFKGKVTTVRSMNVQVEIRGVVKNKRWLKLNARSVPDLDLPIQTINLEELHDKFKHVKHIPFAGYAKAVPQVLIGLDNCHLIPNLKSIKLNQCAIAAKTPLGWVIYGQPEASDPTDSERTAIIHHIRIEDEESFEKLVHDYFTTENFGVAMPREPIESDDVKRARQILKDTCKRLDKNFETGLLWKSDDVKMPDSFNMAMTRLRSLEKKMKNDPEFATVYKKGMAYFISNGYARKLSPEETAKTFLRKWYLPHFAVFNVNKPGKLRLVFDAAATVNRTSLNSVLLKGPDENQSLLKILFQFREGVIAVCADIKDMFLQVRIREADQHAQRFLWRFNQNEPVGVYAMVSMIFGATCSPYIAQYIKNQNALEYAKNQPEVVDAILNNHYVDDMVCSFQNEEEAIRISATIKETHARAGFNLRGFVSNSVNVQQKLNGNTKNECNNVNMNSADNVERVLGMYWRSDSDEFTFKLQMNRVDPAVVTGSKCPTKRELLSVVMSVYDPFGMLANFLIYGKILIQELWRSGTEWDQAIPTEIYNRFAQWVVNFQAVREFRVPRCYSPHLVCSKMLVELHIFNDASETAFASVAYWRIVINDSVHVCFIAGKTKCAPLKALSIPRLELQAAILGTRLKNIIIKCHRIRPQRTILWTDSSTVISWIKSDHRQYKPFVMHRVGEILESTKESEWRWIPTEFNAADVATRTRYPVNYSPDNVWIKGPSFLSHDEEIWPQPLALRTPVTKEEMRKHCMVTTETCVIDFGRFSSYMRLCRTIAWVIRFCNLCRKRVNRELVYELKATEIRIAEIKICQFIQYEMYEKEMNDLKLKGNVSIRSSILKLTPQLNADGLMCVYGRIDYAKALPESAKHPIILPNHHTVTDMIINWYHHKFFHQNDELVVNEIRRKFWIPHLRTELKRIRSKCQQCKNNRAVPKPPLMGQLPIDRLQPYVRPFTYTGLDYFGPMYVTIGRRREKRWAALFTCLTIRAIHIELVTDLSTDACIIAIRNFVNRRGVPVKIRSDMGTNFVGAEKELKRTYELFDHNYIQRELATKNITWEFNCPANPSSGGCWERLIRTTKRVLAVTLHEIAPHVETLRSLLIEAENIVNSRPLTHLPVTPENPDPLTPNHFLLGTTNSTQTPYDDGQVCTRRQYRVSQQLKNQFWRRWIREYMPTLTKRTKWFMPQAPIAVDDLVIICDESQPRSQWRRGIVTRKLTAKDGITRVVEVRTAHGTLRRPVSKLAVLEVCREVPGNCHEGENVADAE